MLEYLAPEIADEHEYQRLLDQERRAAAATRLTLRRRGDGSTDLHARIPDLAASLLRTYLNAFTAPRRRHQHRPHTRVIGARVRPAPAGPATGIAFVALLERVLKTDLPRHGGKATTLVVLIDHDTLVADLTAAGIAQTTTGEKITAGQARRLACHAGISPRSSAASPTSSTKAASINAFFDTANASPSSPRPDLHRADCTMPAAFSRSPPHEPWAEGGTDRPRPRPLLCPFHHGNAPTTPAGTSTTTPTAPPPSPDANRPCR